MEYASSRYGGEDYALARGGNEMPGYHTGPATYIGVMTGARHSHLDNAGYSVDQKILAKKQSSPEEIAEALVNEEHWRQILSSLVVCFFARSIYEPQRVSRALQLAGFNLSIAELNRIGKEIYEDKYRFKTREGFTLDNLRLPKRIFETPAPAGKFDEKFIREAVGHIKKLLIRDGVLRG